MACSHTTTCPLFPLISVNSALKVWKTFYCEGKYDTCARYVLSHSGQSVPANLLPNGKSLSATGMASERLTGEKEKSRAVEQAAPQIIEEMASIDLGEAPAEINIDMDLDLDIEAAPAPKVIPAARVEPLTSSTDASTDGGTHSWYLRILASTDTGVVGSAIKTLGGHRIKIDAMAEKRPNGREVAMILIVLTDQTTEEVLNKALSELQALPTIVGPIKRIKLEHLSTEMFS